MGASFFWQPQKGKNLTVGLRSKFKDTFEGLFGEMPFTLYPKDQEALTTAARMWGLTMGHENNPFAALAEALQDHDAIRVWAEY